MVRIPLSQLPYPAFVFDTGGRVIEANEPSLTLLGRQRIDLLGTSITELVRLKTSELLTAFSMDMLHGYTHSDHAWALQHKDGSWIPVLVRATRLSAAEWGVFARDVRQSEADSATLLYQMELIRTITDNATTAIFMMDERSQCTFMNPAAEKMTGYSFAEIEGGILHDFIHHHYPDGRPYPMHDCPIDRALPEAFDVIGHGDVFIRKNGEMFPVEVNAKPIRENKKTVGTVIEVRDVTAEREVMETLARADRDKDQFIATLAHELRNPLAPINAASAILQSRPLKPEQLGWATEVIQRQAKQMAVLLDDLLDVARIATGKFALRLEEVPLAEVLQTAVQTAQPMMDSKAQSFKMDYPPGVVVRMDPTRVAQALGNVLINASKFTAPEGQINLEGALDADCLTIAIKDSGIGMEPGNENRLFQTFARSDSSVAGDGLGIGLALSKRLVELHHGTISAFSEGTGKGSKFTMTFPGAVIARCLDAVPDPHQSGAPRSYRVVVADDNIDAADSLAMILQGAGHKVETVYSGQEALAAILDSRPDVAVLDIGMPDLDGLEVARLVRQSELGAAIKLIAVTGWGQEEDRIRSQRAGFDAHFTKPVDIALLNARLAPPSAH